MPHCMGFFLPCKASKAGDDRWPAFCSAKNHNLSCMNRNTFPLRGSAVVSLGRISFPGLASVAPAPSSAVRKGKKNAHHGNHRHRQVAFECTYLQALGQNFGSSLEALRRCHEISRALDSTLPSSLVLFLMLIITTTDELLSGADDNAESDGNRGVLSASLIWDNPIRPWPRAS